MRLDVHGHPIHTRALAVTLVQRDDGLADVRAYVLDLRKRGVVPVAGDLQGPGLIHHMEIDAVVNPGTGVLDEIAVRQPNVAFEPSPVTRGESCRDPAARIEALRGSTLDGGYARRLSSAIGGPRGCSHVLTLAQLLGSSVRWALEHDVGGERRPGERVFRRDIAIDGHEPDAGRVEVAIQATDLHFSPSAAVARPMSRFGRQREVRALARVDLARASLAGLEIAERHRSFDDLGDASWRLRADVANGLTGRSVVQGISGALLERLSAAPADAPIYDALLMLAPAMIQCFAAITDSWLVDTRDADTLIGVGGIPDSCYMWRRDGVLHRARRPGDPVPGILK
jgi:hypothetical protein